MEPAVAKGDRRGTELSATHHRLGTFEPTIDRERRQDLEFYRQDLERADIGTGDVDLKDPAKADVRRQALERRAKELRENEQRRLEQIRENLLRALTSAAS